MRDRMFDVVAAEVEVDPQHVVAAVVAEALERRPFDRDLVSDCDTSDFDLGGAALESFAEGIEQRLPASGWYRIVPRFGRRGFEHHATRRSKRRATQGPRKKGNGGPLLKGALPELGPTGRNRALAIARRPDDPSSQR